MDTPKWQLWLLARVPRPVAILLIMLETTLEVLFPWIVVGIFFFVLGILGTLFGAALPIGIIVLGGALLCLLAAYTSIDGKLPKREKKDDDQ